VVGGELWRPRKRQATSIPTLTNETETDATSWARSLAKDWFSPAERALKQERLDREEENVLKFRVDDGWNVKALWTGRVKSLLVEVGVSVNPVNNPAAIFAGGNSASMGDVSVKRWTGNVGVSIAYST